MKPTEHYHQLFLTIHCRRVPLNLLAMALSGWSHARTGTCPWLIACNAAMIFSIQFVIFLCPAHPLCSVVIYTPNRVCFFHSHEDSYKRTLKMKNIWLAQVEQDGLSSKADFQCSIPLALLLGHRQLGCWNICFPCQSIIPVFCHTRSTIPDCRTYQQVYALAFLRESWGLEK